MFKRNPLWINILIVIGFFVAGSILISLVSGILWFAIKILLPVAIVMWLLQVISGRRRGY